MLEQMRQQSRSLLIYLLFGIVIVVFVINFGPQSSGACGQEGRVEGDVARVGDRILTRQDYIYGLTMVGGGDIPPQRAKMMRLHETVMDLLIDREILAAEALRRGFRVSDEEVENLIMESKVTIFGRERSIDAFKKNDVFNYENFRKFVLYQLGMSPRSFIDVQRRELLASHLRNAIRLGLAVPTEQVKAMWEVETNQVNVEYLRFPMSRYENEIELKADEIAAYAAANEASLRKLYDERKAAVFEKQPKQRRLREILVQVKSDAPEADVELAKKRAETLAARIRKGESFAKVAKAGSDDQRTKIRGGDLGWQRQGGSFVDPAVEAELVKVKDGELVGPIKTANGFYLMVSEATREGTIDFAAAKTELAEEKLREEKSKSRAKAEAEAALAKAKAAGDKSLKDLFPAPPESVQGIAPIKAEETGLFSRHGNRVPMLGQSPGLAKAVFGLTTEAPFAGPLEEMGSFLLVKLKERKLPDMAEFEKNKLQMVENVSNRKGEVVATEWTLRRCREARDAKRIEVNADTLRYEGGPEGAIRYEPCSPQSLF
jgi:peptidyl-prolyl cis-trans isomerase D